nr:type IV secretion system protein [Escherichia coli]
MSFATAGGWYQQELVNVALHLPDDFAGILSAPNKVGASGVPAIIDSGMKKVSRSSTPHGKPQTCFSSSGLAAYAIGGIMMIATVVLGGLGAGFVIMAKILLAVTLCFGPIAIFCLLWGATKNIFARWLASVINYGLVVVILALVFGFIMQMFDNLLSSMNSDAAYSSITGSISALLLTVISVFVLFQIPQIAASWVAVSAPELLTPHALRVLPCRRLAIWAATACLAVMRSEAVTVAAASNRQVEEVAATAEEAVVLI